MSRRRASNFAMTMDISCFSFTAVCQRAAKLMPNGGSLLTLTYYGAERVMPHYNVMGVAKAALEASVRYLAADLGVTGHPRQRHLRRADQDAGRLGHRRFPLHPALERAELAAEAQRHDRAGRRRRALSAERPVPGRHRRGASRRQRLSRRRHAAHRCGAGGAGRCCRTSIRRTEACRTTASASLFRFTTWGESHGPAIGCVVDGRPPLIPLSEADIQPWLDRRRPGQSRFVTQRRESDAGAHPVGRVRGQDHRHAHQPVHRERGSALQGLQRESRTSSAPAMPTTPIGPNTASATIAAAAAPRRARRRAAWPPAPSPARSSSM